MDFCPAKPVSSAAAAAVSGLEAGASSLLIFLPLCRMNWCPKCRVRLSLALAGIYSGLRNLEDERHMPDQLLTLEQVAEYLNVDKFTVYRLLSDKDLPAFKVGNQWRFKRRLIENWLAKNSNTNRKSVPGDQ
jgi:excisionase family DNA binding protein